MPIFEYRGVDTGGKNVRGIIDADSPRQARSKLKKTGVFPTEVQEAIAAERRERRDLSITRLIKKVRIQDLAVMTRQLATLVGAGFAMVPALNSLANQVENPNLKKVVSQIRERVREGTSLSDAMREFPRIFSNLYVNMVAAGESSGALDIVLLRLADFTENQVKLRNRVTAALIYPILMVFLASAAVAFLMVRVVPRILELFEDWGRTLPLPTVILLDITNFLRNYGWILLFILVGAFLVVVFYLRTERGRFLFDRLALRVPIFGRLIRIVATTRFSRTLGTLLVSGIPVVRAMNIVKNIVSNRVIAEAIEDSQESIVEGQSIAAPLARSGVFPPMVTDMIAIGENSGQLEQMLLKVSDAYDNQIETTVSGLTSILEPLLILVMGGIVLFIVLAVLLPIFEMNQMVVGQ
ncbi:MAG: type II secretion system inner membrane protein GspF [Proteobacteria bacterium]|nr:type II secretion system inner membrane protein GspF [Pseudomonadota bacterium]